MGERRQPPRAAREARGAARRGAPTRCSPHARRCAAAVADVPSHSLAGRSLVSSAAPGGRFHAQPLHCKFIALSLVHQSAQSTGGGGGAWRWCLPMTFSKNGRDSRAIEPRRYRGGVPSPPIVLLGGRAAQRWRSFDFATPSSDETRHTYGHESHASRDRHVLGEGVVAFNRSLLCPHCSIQWVSFYATIRMCPRPSRTRPCR